MVDGDVQVDCNGPKGFGQQRTFSPAGKAHDLDLNRLVTLKTLDHASPADDKGRWRFEREEKPAAVLDRFLEIRKNADSGGMGVADARTWRKSLRRAFFLSKFLFNKIFSALVGLFCCTGAS